MMLLTAEERKVILESLKVGYSRSEAISKAQVRKVVELLEDALENSFVMAYVGEDTPYESTIDPITIREIIDDMRQSLLEEVKDV